MSLNKRFTSVFCALFVIISFVCTAFPAEAASGPTITTTLTDNIVQKGSKKTFDVWARNSAGEKINATVKLNGQNVYPTWDDDDKTSYTLKFTKEGENIITISASSDGGRKKELTYHITYKKAGKGESIGSATWSVELFTIGCGYLIYPVEMPIYEGETAAEQLIRLLHNNGFVGYYNGTPKSSFYLGYIADGTASGAKYNNYAKSGTPQNPKKLNLSPSVPSLLVPFLNDTMTFFDPKDYKNNWSGYIGEFVFTNGSGWMYSVNNNFPNVGFADSYLSDGDVVRVQYTLAYGADIGGLGSIGSSNIPNADNQPQSGYYKVANKDELSKAICRVLSSGLMSRDNVKKAYATALSTMETLNASQGSVNNAVRKLSNALADSVKETTTIPQKTTTAIAGSNTHSPSTTNGSNSSATSSSSTHPSGSLNTGSSIHSNNSSSTSVSGSLDGSSSSTGSISTGASTTSNGYVHTESSTDSISTGSSINSNIPSNINSSTNLTDQSNTLAGTEANAGTDPYVPSTGTQDDTSLESQSAVTENASNSDTANSSEKIAVNGSEPYKNESNTEINSEKDNASSIKPFVIIGDTIFVLAAVAAAIIAVYIRNKKTKAVGNHETEENNSND